MSSSSDRLRFIKGKDGVPLLPFQYYDRLGFVTLPAEGKRVLIKEWSSKTATVHPSYVHQNTCVLCGKASGITVVDVDMKDNGMTTFRRLVAEHGVPNTPTVSSPTGIHMYFRYVPDLPSMNRLVDSGVRVGIDVQNDGSIVIAPPSTFNGKHYRFKRGYSFEDVSVMKMPAWLKKYIMNHIKPSTSRRHGLK